MQLALLGILIAFGHFRKLPLFTVYLCLNVVQALILYPVYRSHGRYSHVAYVVAWWSEAITLLARVFATGEILHLVLIAYRGIWGLAWRVIAVTSAVVLVFVAATSWADPELALMRTDRGYHLIFAAALISCLVLIRYYFIHVESPYKDLLIGFCFYSCVMILLNTVLYDVFYKQRSQSAPIWQILSLAPYLVVLLFWGVALVRPSPARQEQSIVMPPSEYGRISPEIHLQLQAINQQLMNFWKIKEPPR